ncbi:hypothetical protein FKM82_023407 [Ascaphus truei]
MSTCGASRKLSRALKHRGHNGMYSLHKCHLPFVYFVREHSLFCLFKIDPGSKMAPWILFGLLRTSGVPDLGHIMLLLLVFRGRLRT